MLSTSFSMKVDKILRRALPGHCVFCLSPAAEGEPWCAACFALLPWNHSACQRCAEPLPEIPASLCGRCLKQAPAYVRARVGLRYEGEVAGLIQRFKFGAEPRAGSVLAALMLASLADCERQWSPQALLALPAHQRRARERGFDQAHWLAKRLAQHLRLPLLEAYRHRDTPTQRGLDRKARQRNVHGAFVVDAPLPAKVAIVDDIMTTGASLEALTRACFKAGAEEVEVWAIARTPYAI